MDSTHECKTEANRPLSDEERALLERLKLCGDLTPSYIDRMHLIEEETRG